MIIFQSIEALIRDLRERLDNYGAMTSRRAAEDAPSTTMHAGSTVIVERHVEFSPVIDGRAEEVAKVVFRIGLAEPLSSEGLRLFEDAVAAGRVSLPDELVERVRHQKAINQKLAAFLLSSPTYLGKVRLSFEAYLRRKVLCHDEVTEFGTLEEQQRYCQLVLAEFFLPDGTFGWLEEPPAPERCRPSLIQQVAQQKLRAA
jgi:hypothetical protein